ncbi:MAG: hypothetical protein GY754_09250 [bacterium]|nr:hypothetical protein [bacterium]
MKKIAYISLIAAFLAIFRLPLEAQPKTLTIKLKGRTDTIAATIPSKKATVRFKQEGAAAWVSRSTIRLNERKRAKGYTYSFRINTRVKGTVGKNIIAEVFAKLSDGREIYKESKISVSSKSDTIRLKTILSQFRGIAIAKETPPKKEKSSVKATIIISGKTSRMKGTIPDDKITIKMKYSGKENWFYSKQVRTRKSGNKAGTTYTYKQKFKKKIKKNKPISIEASAKLSDGREIFGTLETKVPGEELKISINPDKFRGVATKKEDTPPKKKKSKKKKSRKKKSRKKVTITISGKTPRMKKFIQGGKISIKMKYSGKEKWFYKKKVTARKSKSKTGTSYTYKLKFKKKLKKNKPITIEASALLNDGKDVFGTLKIKAPKKQQVLKKTLDLKKFRRSKSGKAIRAKTKLLNIELNGLTRTMPVSIPSKKATIRFKREGDKKWASQQTVTLAKEKRDWGYTYSFKTKIRVTGTVGKKIILEAFAKMENEKELYKKWKIPVTKRFRSRQPGITLSKSRAVPIGKGPETGVMIYINGKTIRVKETIPDGKIMVKIRYADREDWVITEEVGTRSSENSAGSIYRYNLELRGKLKTYKPLFIETSAELSDGSEIFGSFETKIPKSKSVLRASVDLDRFERGEPPETRFVKIELLGVTGPMPVSIPTQKATVRFKPEEAKKWKTQKTVNFTETIQPGEFSYSFKTTTRVSGTVGRKIIAEAFAKLEDGREVYKTWKIPVTKNLRILKPKISLSQFREKKPLIEAALELEGKTSHMKERILDNKITVKLKYADQGNWLFQKNVLSQRKKNKTGNTYSFTLKEKKKLEQDKAVTIEASAILEDGREIYGTLNTKLTTLPGQKKTSAKLGETLMNLGSRRGRAIPGYIMGSGEPTYVDIQFTGETDSMRSSIPSKKAIIRIKQEGERKWDSEREVSLIESKQNSEYIYSFKTNVRIRGIIGENLIAEAFAKLRDGREVYEELEILVEKQSTPIQSTVTLPEFRGTATEDVILEFQGETPFMEEEEFIPDGLITVKMKYSARSSWFFNKQVNIKQNTYEDGITYSYSLRFREKLKKNKPISIEVSANLSDGREIFGSFETEVPIGQKRLKTPVNPDQYRGEKLVEAAEGEDEEDEANKLLDIVLKGNVSISNRIIKKLQLDDDDLPEDSSAVIVLKDPNGEELESFKIDLTADNYNNYRGELPDSVKLPPTIETVKVDTTITTQNGKTIFRQNQSVGFKVIGGKKALELRLRPILIR